MEPKIFENINKIYEILARLNKKKTGKDTMY